MLYHCFRPNLAKKKPKKIVQICLNSVHHPSEKPSALATVCGSSTAFCFEAAIQKLLILSRVSHALGMEY